MKIREIIFKKKTIPSENPTSLITCVQLWEVRWESRHGSFHSEVSPEIEVFTSEQEAIAFKKSLDDAFRLIRHTSATKVTITKSE